MDYMDYTDDACGGMALATHETNIRPRQSDDCPGRNKTTNRYVYALTRLQILDGVRGHLQDVALIGIVLRVGALVGRAVEILHRELAAAVADAEDGALELGVAGLSLPHVELADEVNLAVPRAERIDAIDLGEQAVALLVLILLAGEDGGNVEVEAVVVFRPAGTLDGDELAAVADLGTDAVVERMAGEIDAELAAGVQAHAHAPGVVVDDAGTGTDGVVVAAQHAGLQAA